MQINTSNLQNILINLNKLINEYESNYLNFYNELSNVSFYWNDTNSNKFFDKVYLKKNKVKKTINELNEIKEVYKYIIDNYKKIGNKIEFNLSNKKDFEDKSFLYKEKFNNIIKAFNRLDYDKLDINKANIEKAKQKIIDSQTDLLNLIYEITKISNNIEEIEKNISKKLSEINIEILKEN